MGEDLSVILELITARLKVIDTARPKKSCRRCEKITQVPAPSRPIPRSMAGPGLLAHILVSKFDDHLPLYRQNEIFARMGADIPDSTLVDWCGQGMRVLGPLVERIRADVMDSDRLHADDTPIRVLDRGRMRSRYPTWQTRSKTARSGERTTRLLRLLSGTCRDGRGQGQGRTEYEALAGLASGIEPRLHAQKTGAAFGAEYCDRPGRYEQVHPQNPGLFSSRVQVRLWFPNRRSASCHAWELSSRVLTGRTIEEGDLRRV